jgi:hypothetical protein
VLWQSPTNSCCRNREYLLNFRQGFAMLDTLGKHAKSQRLDARDRLLARPP